MFTLHTFRKFRTASYYASRTSNFDALTLTRYDFYTWHQETRQGSTNATSIYRQCLRCMNQISVMISKVKQNLMYNEENKSSQGVFAAASGGTLFALIQLQKWLNTLCQIKQTYVNRCKKLRIDITLYLATLCKVNM